MEIKNYGSAVSAYVKNAYEPAKKKITAPTVKNTDKAEFSAASGAGALANAKASAKKTAEKKPAAKKTAAKAPAKKPAAKKSPAKKTARK